MLGPGCSNLLISKAPLLLKNSVRFARKPRWVPMAKSKMFKNRELPYRPPHEMEEMTRLKENYRVYNNSLWAFQRQINMEEEVRKEAARQQISEEGEWDLIAAQVERDNEIVKAIREQRRKEEWSRLEAEVLSKRAEEEEKARLAVEGAEEVLKTQLERLSTAITAENLDEAIDKALSSRVDYEYAIDKNSQVYRGRDNRTRAEDVSKVHESECIRASVLEK